MPWLGPPDDATTSFVKEQLGQSQRELVHLWRVASTVCGPEDWIALVNELAVAVPGTLASRALLDDRMPPRFRLVAPDFESLGWRVLEPGEAVEELAQVLATGLLEPGEVREVEAAAEAAMAFVSVFGEAGQFLSNLAPEDQLSTQRSTGSWATACPLTPAVAEAGVVGVGSGRAGILWAAES